MPGLVYIKTFGCQMNEYDSGKMHDVLEAAHGMTRTEDPALADVQHAGRVNSIELLEADEFAVEVDLTEDAA